MSTSQRSCPARKTLIARVRPGVEETRARSLRHKALSKVLLPTFERPTKVSSAAQGPRRAGSVSLRRKRTCSRRAGTQPLYHALGVVPDGAAPALDPGAVALVGQAPGLGGLGEAAAAAPFLLGLVAQ